MDSPTSASNALGRGEREVLTLGDYLTSPGFVPVFDPIGAGTAPQYVYYLYDSLLRQKLDGGYAPALALGADVVDPATVAVRLRPGVLFQDGTCMDAEAVKFTILRNKESNSVVGFNQTLLQTVEAIDVLSPVELTIRLSKPIAATFYHLLAHTETAPVSPTAVRAGKDLDLEPVGAGPFELVSRSDQRVRMQKWPGYYGAEKVHFAGIDIVDITDPELQSDALLTGRADFVNRLYFVSLGELRGSGVKIKMLDVPQVGFDHVWYHCRSNPEVLGDVRVRRALIHATDREAINKALYGGRSEIQSQWVASNHPAFDAELTGLYAFDVEKARSLLAAAGKTDLNLTMARHSLAGARIAELLRQQWARAGITLTIEPTKDPTDEFYVRGKHPLLAFSGGSAFWWTDIFTRIFATGGFELCPPTDPTFSSGLDALLSMDPDSPEAHALFQQLTRVIMEEARFLPITMAPNPIAWTNHIQRITVRQTISGHPFVDFLGTRLRAE